MERGKSGVAEPLPQERPSRSAFERSLEVVALIGLVAGAAIAAEAWPNLPKRIPTQFDSRGIPTEWGGKGLLLLLPAVSIFVYGLLSLARRLPLRFYNIPWRVTPENAPRQYELARSLLATLKTEIIWLCAILEWEMTRSAASAAPRFPAVLFPVALGLILATVGIYIRKSYLAR